MNGSTVEGRWFVLNILSASRFWQQFYCLQRKNLFLPFGFPLNIYTIYGLPFHFSFYTFWFRHFLAGSWNVFTICGLNCFHFIFNWNSCNVFTVTFAVDQPWADCKSFEILHPTSCEWYKSHANGNIDPSIFFGPFYLTEKCSSGQLIRFGLTNLRAARGEMLLNWFLSRPVVNWGHKYIGIRIRKEHTRDDWQAGRFERGWGFHFSRPLGLTPTFCSSAKWTRFFSPLLLRRLQGDGSDTSGGFGVGCGR